MTSRISTLARRSAVALSCTVTLSCALPHRRESSPAPALLLGEFSDDYGSSYRITADAFVQDGRQTYRVVSWHEEAQYLIAQNAPTNASAASKWTRIDWLALDGMAPYAWAFCLSAYDADSKATAEAVRIARRSTPRTGCNGFPFTRMKRR